MYARVTRWEGGEAEAMRGLAKQMNDQPGPPEGVPAKGVTMLIDADSGKGIVISLFETEEDMRQGDETLQSMSPPDDMGRRVAVETYEVGADIRAS